MNRQLLPNRYRHVNKSLSKLRMPVSVSLERGITLEATDWRAQIENKLYSFKWPCGVLPNFIDFRYRSGYRGVSLRASLRGPENVWSQGYVSSDTKFWQAQCCNSTPGQWLWRSVRDRTRMLFQHISARSLSESTSSPSPSSSASSPSSSSWCVMN